VCKYPTENAISEKLGLTIDNPARAPFSKFTDEQLALEENHDIFGILESLSTPRSPIIGQVS
jgi:hypothetical protein